MELLAPRFHVVSAVAVLFNEGMSHQTTLDWVLVGRLCVPGSHTPILLQAQSHITAEQLGIAVGR